MNSCPTKKATKLPNIIYIYADDLGYAELGCYGQQKIKTPNLDKMAEQGMRFTQHYTSTPVCAPARCMLMTGKHSGHSYIRGNYELGGFPDSAERGQLPLKADEFTVAELVKQKGYATALMGKWGLGMNGTEGSPNRQGFDYYYAYLDQKQAHNFYPTHLWENEKWDSLHQPFINVHRRIDSSTATEKDFEYFKGKKYTQELFTQKALRFMEQNKERNFFLYLPYTIPHVSLQVPDEYVGKYIGLFNEKPYYGQQGYASAKYPLSTYAAMITYLDEQVGVILDKVKALGLEENTIVLFSSDNGTTFNGGVDAEFFNSVGGLRGLKMDLYEGGIRMPFIVRWPGKIKAGSISHHISAQYDFFATVAELTGQAATNTDGISFLPTLLGKKQKQHEYLYFEYPEKNGQLAIRMGNWKAVKTGLKKNPANTWQLFDLRADRCETTDIAGKHPELLKQFDAIVEKEHREPAVKQWQFVKAVIKQHQ
ncbi:MAG: arylsulfatase [Chitinophagaceae bacterium]